MRPWLSLWPFVISFALAAWSLPQQPERLPTHWGPNGQPDQWGSAAQALFQLPGMLFPAALLMLIIERAVPNEKKNAAILGSVRLGLGLLALIQTASLAFDWDNNRAILIGVGLVFALIGNVMGRTSPSAFIGLRTPWVFLSRRAWHASQRRGGVWFAMFGILLAGSALLAPQSWLNPWIAPYGLLLGLAVMVPFLVYSSYHDWKTDPDPQPVQL